MHGTRAIEGSIPHFWLVEETTDQKLVNMTLEYINCKINIKIDKGQIEKDVSTPTYKNSKTIAKDSKLAVKVNVRAGAKRAASSGPQAQPIKKQR